MNYIRKNAMSILLFILWVGMSVSLVTAKAEVQSDGATGESCTIDLAFITHSDALVPASVSSGLPVED